MEVQINMTAVLIAVVANFVLGFLWYTPIFGKVWAKEMGYDPDMKPEKGPMIKGMIFMVIGNFLLAYVFAHNMAAWAYVPGADEMSAMATAMNAAIFTWLGFFVPSHLGATVWEKKSWKLTAINLGYHLAALILVAMILAHMS